MLGEVRRIEAAELSTEDLARLTAFCNLSDIAKLGYTAKHLIEDEIGLKKAFYRIDLTTGKGLMITEIRKHPNGKEFLVYGVIGKGIMQTSIEPVVREIARHHDCRWITWMTTQEGMMRLYRRKWGVNPKAWFFMEDTDASIS